MRRAETQIKALFDRKETQIFPPPGVNRENSFFAKTVPSSENPARCYLGLAAQGRGPKLVFLRGLTTLLAAAQAELERAPGENGSLTRPTRTLQRSAISMRYVNWAERGASSKTKCATASAVTAESGGVSLHPISHSPTGKWRRRSN